MMLNTRVLIVFVLLSLVNADGDFYVYREYKSSDCSGKAAVIAAANMTAVGETCQEEACFSYGDEGSYEVTCEPEWPTFPDTGYTYKLYFDGEYCRRDDLYGIEATAESCEYDDFYGYYMHTYCEDDCFYYAECSSSDCTDDCYYDYSYCGCETGYGSSYYVQCSPPQLDATKVTVVEQCYQSSVCSGDVIFMSATNIFFEEYYELCTEQPCTSDGDEWFCEVTCESTWPTFPDTGYSYILEYEEYGCTGEIYSIEAIADSCFEEEDYESYNYYCEDDCVYYTECLSSDCSDYCYYEETYCGCEYNEYYQCSPPQFDPTKIIKVERHYSSSGCTGDITGMSVLNTTITEEMCTKRACSSVYPEGSYEVTCESEWPTFPDSGFSYILEYDDLGCESEDLYSIEVIENECTYDNVYKESYSVSCKDGCVHYSVCLSDDCSNCYQKATYCGCCDCLSGPRDVRCSPPDPNAAKSIDVCALLLIAIAAYLALL